MSETKPIIDLTTWTAEILALIPDAQRPAATALLVSYAPQFYAMAKEDVWAAIRRLLAGDLTAVLDLHLRETDAEFLARVQVNTARWENVAAYNVLREETRNQLLLRLAPIIGAILAALVGL